MSLRISRAQLYFGVELAAFVDAQAVQIPFIIQIIPAVDVSGIDGCNILCDIRRLGNSRVFTVITY